MKPYFLGIVLDVRVEMTLMEDIVEIGLSSHSIVGDLWLLISKGTIKFACNLSSIANGGF
jgi:hypothetical protein